MKAVFSTWDDRIAPVFDASEQIRFIEVESGKMVQNLTDTLPDDLPVQRALRLAEMKADVLFCGAISQAMHEVIVSYGIRVIPFITGALDEVVRAWMSGLSDWRRFSMPGCGAGGRYCRRNDAGTLHGERTMGRRDGGPGAVGPATSGNGRHFQTRAHGSGGGKRLPSAYCVCPRCGERQRHAQGIPCNAYRCPACGIPMIRDDIRG